MLFSMQNRISVKGGTNHWIPFTEQEVDAKDSFKSHFISDYIHGKQRSKKDPNKQTNWLEAESMANEETISTTTKQGEPITFSHEAQAVLDSGKALWTYYHKQPDAITDAALFDIRVHFQGINEKGKMNNSSLDKTYSSLITSLRDQLKKLAKKIEVKVYGYGFLKNIL